jgi:hypothetical protein
LGSQALAETKYIPTAAISGRYDSNVFFQPKEFIPPDRQAWDFVTAISGGLNIINKSRLGDTELRVGASGNVFTYNRDFSYASTNAFLSSDLSPWMNELIRGLNLRISDTFQYTPEPAAFLTGGKPEQSDIFARGIQAYRANTYTNNFSTDAGYSLTRSWNIQANYTFSFYRIGRIQATPIDPVGQLGFFDTTVHSASVGPAYRFEGGDTLYLRYGYVASESVPVDVGGFGFKYTGHTLQPQYMTTIVRGWTATISGGATLVEQVGSRIFFSGSFRLINDFDRRTRVSFSVSRQAAPAYFATGGAMISNVAQLFLSHNLSRVVTLTISGNYAYNETTPVDTFTFTTIATSAALEYKLTRSFKLSLSQAYSYYEFTGVPGYDRYVTMLTLQGDWK